MEKKAILILLINYLLGIGVGFYLFNACYTLIDILPFKVHSLPIPRYVEPLKYAGATILTVWVCFKLACLAFRDRRTTPNIGVTVLALSFTYLLCSIGCSWRVRKLFEKH